MERGDYNKKSRDNYHKRRKKKECSICGTVFYGTDKQKNCAQHRYNRGVKKDNYIVYKTCKICGKTFYGKRTLCSDECHAQYINSLKKEKVLKKCDFCGKDILLFPCHVHEHNFCCRGCSAKWKFNKPNYKIRGHKHPSWKGGIKARDNSTLRIKRWREKVFLRDDYVCQFCGKGGNIMAHHIVAWADDINMRFNITNGITLCEVCHKNIHGGNFCKPINYEYTKNKCEKKGIRLRKKISNRIEELIRERGNRHSKESK